MIIAVDVGGTKTNVALLESPRELSDAGKSSVLLARAKYQSTQHAGLGAILSDFMSTYDIAPLSVTRVCAGIAGPVVEGHAETPNLPWDVDAAGLSRELGVKSVTLINDL